MKKAFDQTVRDLKRGVNKKVLKVPSIEQKVLDSTSNEPWGPHGSHLADIAQATRNYHEFQMIMTVIWKRINDTGKNWRHVYKALTVLEYLVANGSERVTEEIKEHAYQISTLSNFQYIDSGGRDQGSNVRRKSASLVELVNDSERIVELRQKAASNKDKFRGQAPAGGMNKPGAYDDERRESRYGTRDDAWTDPYGNEPGSDERDDERTGRRHSISDRHSGSRSRSSDRDHPDDLPRPLSRKYSEQNLAAPPSYEEAVGGRSPGQTRNNEDAAEATVDPSPPPFSDQSTNHDAPPGDQFDPRSGVPPDGTEFDLLAALSEPVTSNALVAVVPLTEPAPFAGAGFDDDPFGDSPFKAVPVPIPSPAVVETAGFEIVPTPFDLGGLSYTAPDSNPYTDVLAGILPPPLSPPPPPPQPPQPVFSGVPGGGFYPASEGHFHPVVPYGGILTGGPVGAYAMSAAPGGTQAAHVVPSAAPPAAPARFEPKSAVWADTLSRGLVDLNISGPKINPLSDIGVDFEAMNRRDRRMEKPTPAVPSTVSMGRAMGVGSGIGRAGASVLSGPSGPMMGVHPPGVGIAYPGHQQLQQQQHQMMMMMMPGYNNQAMGGGYMPMPPNQNQQHPYGGYR